MSASASANPTAFSSPHEEALLTLMRTADAMGHTFQQRLKPYGITAPQYNVLRILRGHNQGAQAQGLSCSAIGQMMITSEPDMTRLLARLKAHKLVAQKRDSHDRRVVLTHLTAAGMQLLAKLDALIELTPAELLRNLTSAEVKELTRLLVKARGCCSGKKEAATEAAVTGRPPSPHSPRWPLPRHFRPTLLSGVSLTIPGVVPCCECRASRPGCVAGVPADPKGVVPVATAAAAAAAVLARRKVLLAEPVKSLVAYCGSRAALEFVEPPVVAAPVVPAAWVAQVQGVTGANELPECVGCYAPPCQPRLRSRE